MAKLNWGAAGERFYESGVDHGVLYIDGVGYAWSGLISVTESSSGGQARPFYIDGFKYANIASAEEFEATIQAFSAPREFRRCDGSPEIYGGLIATQQPRRPFDFSYRTMVGNDTDPNYGYKIHLVYNALAAPSQRTNSTQGENGDIPSLSWALTTRPPMVSGIKPTAHFVIDSRSTSPLILTLAENLLYGSDSSTATMPTVTELLALFESLLLIRAVLVAGGYELYETDIANARTFMQPTAPATPAAGELPILWLDNSAGGYAVPKLITGE